MLIRSQNKKRIININTINTIQIEEDNSIFAKGVVYYFLGEYSTKEKAIKVLDMIQNSYQYCEECKYIGVGASQPEFVFQMPQEDEVEL